MKHAALLLMVLGCAAACARPAAGDRAADSNGAASNGAASNAAASNAAASSTAVAATGDRCPFRTRNWRAIADNDNWLMITGEMSANAAGHPAMMEVEQDAPAPAVVVNLRPDASGEQTETWAESGVGTFHLSGFTHVAIRCAGVEIARVQVVTAGQ